MRQGSIIAHHSVEGRLHIFLRELEYDFQLCPKETRQFQNQLQQHLILEGISQSGNFGPGKIKKRNCRYWRYMPERSLTWARKDTGNFQPGCWRGGS